MILYWNFESIFILKYYRRKQDVCYLLQRSGMFQRTYKIIKKDKFLLILLTSVLGIFYTIILLKKKQEYKWI